MREASDLVTIQQQRGTKFKGKSQHEEMERGEIMEGVKGSGGGKTPKEGRG